MYAAEGGGGGSRLYVDEKVLGDVATSLSDSAGQMDATGNALPASSDLGLAGPVLSSLLSRWCEAGGRLALEARTISEAVRTSVDTSAATDAAAAERFLIGGGAHD
ncbi:hypothetical protein GCM10027517_15770 [Phycicoccus ginsengisoli]